MSKTMKDRQALWEASTPPKKAPKRYVVSRAKLVTRLENVVQNINTLDLCATSVDALNVLMDGWAEQLLDIADDMRDEKGDC